MWPSGGMILVGIGQSAGTIHQRRERLGLGAEFSVDGGVGLVASSAWLVANAESQAGGLRRGVQKAMSGRGEIDVAADWAGAVGVDGEDSCGGPQETKAERTKRKM